MHEDNSYTAGAVARNRSKYRGRGIGAMAMDAMPARRVATSSAVEV